MDNDILINQARGLYANLLTRQVEPLFNDQQEGLQRLDRLIIWAYCRYQRRLNRCAVCYQERNYDCIREPGEKVILCQPRRGRTADGMKPEKVRAVG